MNGPDISAYALRPKVSFSAIPPMVSALQPDQGLTSVLKLSDFNYNRPALWHEMSVAIVVIWEQIAKIRKDDTMPVSINPAALKALRNRKQLTQAKLAELTRGRASVATIKRIEGKEEDTYPVRASVAEGLAKALGVTLEQLSQAPTKIEEDEAALKEYGYRPLRTMLDADTALAYKMVERLYGIPVRSQIVMAPLFTALLAEASLAWRRERVSQIKDAAERLMGLGDGHFAFTNAANRSLEGAESEIRSIENCDLFGEEIGDAAYDLGFDPSENNPFADFLKHFAKTVQAKNISFEFEERTGWKTSEGFPDYWIGVNIAKLTNDNRDAEYAFLRGHARLDAIPSELLGEDNAAERVAWMISQIPETEMAQRKADLGDLSSIEF